MQYTFAGIFVVNKRSYYTWDNDEMDLWSTLVDLLRGSGWLKVLKEAGDTETEETATRYVHQITVVVLDSLQEHAYERR